MIPCVTRKHICHTGFNTHPHQGKDVFFFPLAGAFAETAFDQFKHDGYADRCARGGAKQGGNRAVAGRNDFGAELQDAALFCIFLDDLHSLSGEFQAPVRRV